jgi:hypothetical protein
MIRNMRTNNTEADVPDEVHSFRELVNPGRLFTDHRSVD